MEVIVVVVLLVLGIIFFLLELFLIPGISLAGIAGTAFLIGSVVFAYVKISAMAGHLTLLGSIVLLGIAIWIFLKSKALDKMSLKAGIDSKVDPLKDVEIKIGDSGKTLSRLAPMGKVIVNGSVIEAKTNDEFLDPNVEIIVTQIYNTNILVERKK